MSPLSLPVSLLALAVLCLAGSDGDSRRASFKSEVSNLEYAVRPLTKAPPGQIRRDSEVSGDVWYGTIMRRLQGDGPWNNAHYIPFKVEYAQGRAVRAWSDFNLNGDLSDDPPVELWAHPSADGARSFFAEIDGTVRVDSRDVAVHTKVRIVLEAAVDKPSYREQRVYAMVGDLVIRGAAHRAILFDGNGDSVYTKDFGDGLFVDLDDDLHFDIDQMSPSFGPLGADFDMDGATFEILSVDPEGRELVYREKPAPKPQAAAAKGSAAPGFTFKDISGREIRLSNYRGKVVGLYFWASWCGACLQQAPEMAAIYEEYRPKGFELVGVSYDVDRPAMEAFRAKHHHSWPTSFSSRMFWEDPIGRLYRARSSGVVFLIDRDGTLVESFTDMREFRERLTHLLGA